MQAGRAPCADFLPLWRDNGDARARLDQLNAQPVAERGKLLRLRPQLVTLAHKTRQFRPNHLDTTLDLALLRRHFLMQGGNRALPFRARGSQLARIRDPDRIGFQRGAVAGLGRAVLRYPGLPPTGCRSGNAGIPVPGGGAGGHCRTVGRLPPGRPRDGSPGGYLDQSETGEGGRAPLRQPGVRDGARGRSPAAPAGRQGRAWRNDPY